MLHRVLIIIKHLSLNSPRIKKSITLTIFGIIQPVFIYITVQGIIWQDLNYAYTPHCVPKEELPFMIWGWICLLIILDCIFLYIAISKLINWWRIITLERRMHRLLDEVLIMDEQTLRELLLANPSNGLMDYDSRETGISNYDRIRIPKVPYKKISLRNARNNTDICPICCDDFQEEVEVKCLPLCNHVFHATCIDEWLKVNSLCPMCRASVRVNLDRVEKRCEENIYYEECRNIQDLEANS